MQTFIEIFKTGHHTDVNGKASTYTEADLRQAATVYHPDRHEAPLVIGHPKDNAPAYGWVQSLLYQEGKLLAVPRQLDPEFAQKVKDGRFKKVSPSFYLPNNPGNPVPGSLYLRHIGFLGSMPPAIKGLRDPLLTMFAAPGGAQTVEFAMAVVVGEGDRLSELDARAFELDRREAVIIKRMAQKIEYQAPRGFSADPERLELHRFALAFQELHSVSYQAALQAVQENPLLKGGQR